MAADEAWLDRQSVAQELNVFEVFNGQSEAILEAEAILRQEAWSRKQQLQAMVGSTVAKGWRTRLLLARESISNNKLEITAAAAVVLIYGVLGAGVRWLEEDR